MSKSGHRASIRHTILEKIMAYSRKAGQLGRRVRKLVFGFRVRATAHIDSRALPVKLLHEHRLVQRRRVFQLAGGNRASIIQHALNKARRKKSEP